MIDIDVLSNTTRSTRQMWIIFLEADVRIKDAHSYSTRGVFLNRREIFSRLFLPATSLHKATYEKSLH